MNISHRWLQQLLPGLSLSASEVADLLAAQGAPVDELVDIGTPLRDVIIARVEQAQRHPNADRLTLCRVNAGGAEVLQVVCGAPNVKAGAYYPFAPVGAALPGGVTIRRAKIRGEESQGMLCSARELGLGRDHEGILELHGEFDLGRSFIEAIGIDDVRIVVDVTPNRPDLLSHLGVAREVGAAVGTSPMLPRFPGQPSLPHIEAVGPGADEAEASGVTVTIADPDLCSRYFGLVIRGVRVGPSPEWLASRLRVLGLRPISNVVDATNWVLHELGQPLHAFDLDRLGNRVVVRRARSDERITTLDGIDRALTTDMLMIADATRSVAIAGVMGGADTEVQDDTTNVLLECALFDAKSVRSTRRALDLSTDASYRFERGVDPDTMLAAVRRAAELIVATAGGTIEPRVAAPGRGLPDVAPIDLRLPRAAQILGEVFTTSQTKSLLEPLGFGVSLIEDRADAVRVTVPGHRRYDVAREEDVIEELARRHGYENFTDELRPFRPSSVPTHPLFAREARLRELFVQRGFLEAHTAALAPETDGDVALMLPLAATESRLRRSLLPGLLRRVEYNFARGARSIRLFELGTAFAAGGTDGLPHESLHLAVAFTGQRRPPHFSEPAAAFDVWDLKSIAETIAAELSLTLDEAADDPLIDPALSFRLRSDDHAGSSGVAGRIRAERVDAPAWADAVWGIEVRVAVVSRYVVEVAAGVPSVPAAGAHAADFDSVLRYRELPQFPSIERDLALLVPDSVAAKAVAVTIRGEAGALLEAADVFDLYSGKGVAEGTRSIAFRLRFRAVDRTLTDAEVEPVVKRILQRLESDHGIRQRA